MNKSDKVENEDRRAQKGGSSENDAGSVPALEHLRDRIVHAVEEITRLREVNAELAGRVEHLEKVHGVSSGTSSFVLDENPEVLKEKIAGYIKSIDAHLEGIDEEQSGNS